MAMTWNYGSWGTGWEKRGSLVTPLQPLPGPHCTVSTGKQSTQNQVTAVRNNPACAAVSVSLWNALRHSPIQLGPVQAPSLSCRSAIGHQRHNHCLALQIWKNKDLI